MSAAPVLELKRPTPQEAGQIPTQNHAELVSQNDQRWREGVVQHVKKQMPQFRHEHSLPASYTLPLSEQVIRQTGAINADDDGGTLPTGADVKHAMDSGVTRIFTGAQRWLRHMASRYGRKVVQRRNWQKEQLKHHKPTGDYDELAA